MKNKCYPIQLRFSDIDAMGIVHNAVFFQYFEQSRLQFFHEIIGDIWDWKAKGVIVARNEIDYIRPIALEDKVFVEIFCYSIGTTSFTLGYKVITKINDEVHLNAKGISIMVCYNHLINQKQPVYQEWREKLNQFKNEF